MNVGDCSTANPCDEYSFATAAVWPALCDTKTSSPPHRSLANISCGSCFYCQRGQVNHCLRWSAIGVTRDGGFADYVVAPATNVYRVGEMDYEVAAFIEPLSCVVYGLKRLEIPLGANVLIYGAGPIGLLMLQLVRHGGASEIAVVDLKQDKLDLAGTLGATITVAAGPSLIRK